MGIYTIMIENNCITINFPQGSGGHAVGRLISSCNNVLWYDHDTNGMCPWKPYNDVVDSSFTPFHFTRRFKGSQGYGVCEKTVPPVLDFADRSNLECNVDQITEWKKKVYPYNLIYPLHADLDKTKEFFKPAKHIVIIPNNVEQLVDRFLLTTYNYFISWKDKTYTYEKYYNDMSLETGLTPKDCIYNDLITVINNYKSLICKEDVVISHVSDLLDKNYFQKVAEKMQLDFNLKNYEKTARFIMSNFK